MRLAGTRACVAPHARPPATPALPRRLELRGGGGGAAHTAAQAVRRALYGPRSSAAEVPGRQHHRSATTSGLPPRQPPLQLWGAARRQAHAPCPAASGGAGPGLVCGTGSLHGGRPEDPPRPDPTSEPVLTWFGRGSGGAQSPSKACWASAPGRRCARSGAGLSPRGTAGGTAAACLRGAGQGGGGTAGWLVWYGMGRSPCSRLEVMLGWGGT